MRAADRQRLYTLSQPARGSRGKGCIHHTARGSVNPPVAGHNCGIHGHIKCSAVRPCACTAAAHEGGCARAARAPGPQECCAPPGGSIKCSAVLQRAVDRDSIRRYPREGGFAPHKPAVDRVLGSAAECCAKPAVDRFIKRHGDWLLHALLAVLAVLRISP